MRKLLKYLKPYWIFVILTPTLMFFRVLLELYIPKEMANIINIGVYNSDILYIRGSLIKAILAAIFSMILGMACNTFASICSQSFGSDIRLDVFKKIQYFSFENLDKFTTSSLITRLTNDISKTQQIINMGLRMMVRLPLLFIGSIFMAFSISFKLSLILFITIPLLIICMTLMFKYVLPLFKVVQQKVDNLNNVIRENLINVRVIRSFVKEDFEIKKFEEKNNDLKNTSIKSFKILNISNPIVSLITNITIVFVIYIGGVQITNEKLNVGDLMAYMTYITEIMMAIVNFNGIFSMLSRTKASVNRVNEVLDEEIIISNENTKGINDCIKNGEIEFKNVSFKYIDDKKILKNISFKVNSGETIGILGTTGSGKSTLISLIARFYDVDEGEILIDGVNIKDIDLDYLRQNVSISLQKPIIFSGTILENIKYSQKDATDDEIEQFAKYACSFEFIDKLPDRFESILGQGGVNLSGGQKQRVSITRTFLRKPKILILDDSTSAVDTQTEMKIQEALKNNFNNVTKIVIAQKITTVKDMDKIIILEDGEIKGIGNHYELLENNEIYKEIYNSQLKEKEVIKYE